VTAFILEARNLIKHFAGFIAVSEVNLGVREGGIHGIIGPNGAGKTTVFNLLTKFHQPTSGTILHKGEDITFLGPAEIAQRGLVRSFQISAVFPHMTVRENLLVPLQRSLGVALYFWRSEKCLGALHDRAGELMDAVGLDGLADRPAAELPYGRKRALEIATTLALDPQVLLLDEPTSGLGQEDIGRVTALIRKVAATRTIVIIEHNLSVLADLCDRVTVLTRGRVLAEGSYDEISRNPDVAEAYLGLSA
jgi:branched-chain amino acid transport system ATP-binding protein